MEEIEGLIKQATTAPPQKQVELYLEISRLYSSNSESRSLEYAKKAYNISDKYSNKLGKTKAMIELANINQDYKHNPEALDYYRQALGAAEELGDRDIKADVLVKIGNIHYSMGEYSKSLDYFFRSLRILEDIDDKDLIANVSNNIGRGYTASGNNEKALEYFMNCLHIKETSGDEKGLANVSNNIGIIYQKKGEYDKALDFYNRSLEIQEKLGHQRGKASVINNIGIIYSNMNYKEKALQYFFDSLVLKKEIGDEKSISNSYSNIGRTYVELEEYDKALEALALSLDLANKTNAKDLQRQIHKSLADLYEILGNQQLDKGQYREACDHYRTSIEESHLYEDLQIDLYKDAYNRQIADIQTRFETDKRLREAEIFRLKNIELAEANATKDKFFTIIAHDVKNPLNSLLMSVEYLSMQLDHLEPDKVKKLVGVMNKEIKSISELFDNLMQWSGSQTGKMPFSPDKHELLELAKESLKHIETVAAYKEIDISIDIPVDALVHADKNMIMTVLRNLVTNAIKFSHNGSRVSVSSVENDDYWEVSVCDRGVGIEEEHLKKLFRIDSHFTTRGTAHETGTGLGLIVCKEFVEKNNGIIYAESSSGKGSVFTFTLPRA